ncbi:YidC/Oxa1 family membrane protein insertase [Euzebya sp.]|uniref:YidC/Oxa1 family membrane protein insertase n=1 Tax=Euzebya sp. TaxID=1971409 RepID=UPI0035197759
MGFLGDIFGGLQDALAQVLRFYEGLLEPLAGGYAWGLAIILLTVTVRIFLIPLMVRQTRSMRSMQRLQPELKKIQEKYKADRSLIKTDPERYKKLKDKQREAQMALYQEHQVNPVGGCLPLLLQMPIFLALFYVLRDNARVEELTAAPFFGIEGLGMTAAEGAGIGAFVLVALQVFTTFYTQKQMQARNSGNSNDQQAQVQKIMMYVMPAFLGWLSFTFPIGVVLYWVTTNIWTIGQQAYIFKKVEAEEAEAARQRKEERVASKRTRPKGQSGDRRARADEVTGKRDQSKDIVDSGSSGSRPRTNGSNGTPRSQRSSKGGSTGKGKGESSGKGEGSSRKGRSGGSGERDR